MILIGADSTRVPGVRRWLADKQRIVTLRLSLRVDDSTRLTSMATTVRFSSERRQVKAFVVCRSLQHTSLPCVQVTKRSVVHSI